MALFGKKDQDPHIDKAPPSAHQLAGKQAYCTVCGSYRQFSRCWRRTALVRKCSCCELVFESAEALYKKFLPSCPRCGEFLEHPGFDYGLCDKCGTKYELMDGTKPGMLPNKKQRDKMNVYGKSRSRD